MNQLATTDKLIRWFFVASLLFGCLARLYLAIFSDYWLDELWSADFSNPEVGLQRVIEKTLADVHPPLYQISLYYWYQWFGFSEITGRSLSLLFGFLSIPAIYFLGSLFYSGRFALLVTMLFLLNPFAFGYAAEARSYSMLLFLAIISTWSFYYLLQQQSNKACLMYYLFSLAAIYTHYFGVILLGAHALIYVYRLFPRMSSDSQVENIQTSANWRIVSVYLVLALSYLPMLDAIASNLQRSWFWIEHPDFYLLFLYVPVYFGAHWSVLFIGLMVYLTIQQRKQLSTNQFECLLAIVFIIFVPYIAGFFINPISTPRNTIIAIPFCILLFAFLVNNCSSRLRVLALFFMLLAAMGSLWTINQIKGQQIDEFLQHVKKTQMPVYIVNVEAWPTDIFVKTKIALNRDVYGDIKIQEFTDKNNLPKEFWLVCYHTCSKIGLEEQVPENYKIQQALQGKGYQAKYLVLQK